MFTTIHYHGGKITNVERHEVLQHRPGRQWFSFNDPRWALANMIAHPQSRPTNPKNAAAVIQFLINEIGGTAHVDTESFTNPIIPL